MLKYCSQGKDKFIPEYWDQNKGIQTSRRTKTEIEKGKSLTVVYGKKLRILNMQKDNMIDDLYGFLSPFVASIRSQSGLIEVTECWSFKPVDNTGRRSHRKMMLDIMLKHREFGPSQGSFSDQVESFKEVEKFGSLICGISAMLEQRGLYMLSVPSAGLERNQTLRFWLSDTFFRSAFETTLQPELNMAAHVLKSRPDTTLEMLQGDQRAQKWLRNIMDYLLGLLKLQDNDILHSKLFQTRGDSPRCSLNTLRQSFESNSFQLISHLLNKNSLTDVTSALKKIKYVEKKMLSQEWKISTFRLNKSDLK
eukprot:TRINITY_DN19664_c0_g1_i1.p1 TRINITY_DN19664_c0_g1~~TRINITY_DN19664_c0_g1_i1.p1  ORF type:complete len:308 (+),score=28.35 TRINITY_DN19664_c0_g1_i1:136-1059(+)